MDGTNEQIRVAIEGLESSLGRGGFERPDDGGAHSHDSAMRFLDRVEGPTGGRGEMAPFRMHDVVVELLDGNGTKRPQADVECQVFEPQPYFTALLDEIF